ncbi:transporter [Amylibacter kogurei]|uniref:Transporter n=1 Tax=Paramylibacter kogurei TaxID=1889778 RepID=A0A2G5K0P5_9RHOB|nr:AEC family transporter [Amylibacter kogurei]PIB23071.1 transporter [Amylibacter kogurei]
MEIIGTVAQVVAPVFLLAAIGFAWIKAGYEYRIEFVTTLAMTLSVPCLIFVALMESEVDPDALKSTFMASVAAYGAVTVAFVILVKLFKLEMRSFLAPLIFGNTGNLGLPLALFAFGEEGLGHAVIIFAVMAVYSFSVGVWMVSGGGSPLKAIKEPLVWATILGAIFMVMGWRTPEWLTNSIRLVGQIAIPIMLITLGVALARLRAPTLGRAFVLSTVKYVICIAVAVVIGLMFELGPVAFAVLVVQIATPVAVTSYLLAQKYGADADEVAGLVVASTLMSIAVLPLILGFLMA